MRIGVASFIVAHFVVATFAPIVGADVEVDLLSESPPRVLSMDPVPESRQNQVSVVKVTFTDPINPATVTPDTFRLIAAGPDAKLGTADDVAITPASITLDPGALFAQFSASTPLINETYYTILLPTDIVSDGFNQGIDATTWQLNGTASWLASSAEVTMGTTQEGQNGSIFWKRPVFIERFTTEFDFHFALAGATGDGFTFAFWNNSTPVILGSSGGGLGLASAPGTGYAVEFDIFNNGGADPSSNHVALVTSPYSTHLAYTNITPSFATTSLWHVKVDFDRGALKVWLSNATVGFSETLVLNTTIANYKPYIGYLGFTGSTGGSTNVPTFDNISFNLPGAGRVGVASPTGTGLDGEFAGSFPSGNGSNGGIYVARFFVDTLPPVISSTIPAKNSVSNTPQISTVQLVFNEAMNASSVVDTTAYSAVQNGRTAIPIVPQSYDTATRTLALQLNGSQPLADGNYLITIQGDKLKDLAGNALDGNSDGLPGGQAFLSFVVDTVPPHVTSTWPGAAAKVPPDGTSLLEINFDTQVSAVLAQTVSSYRLAGAGFDGNFDSGNEYTVTVNEAFYDPQQKKTYIVVNYGLDLPVDVFTLTARGGTSAGIKDLAGNWLDGDGNGTPGGDFTTRFRIIDPACGADNDSDGVGDACDLCPNTIPGIWVDNAGCPPPVATDLDHDGDVDSDDITIFLACMAGADVSYNPSGPVSGCTLALDGTGHIAADFDKDGDVDMDDYSVVQRCHTGSNNPAVANCAN